MYDRMMPVSLFAMVVLTPTQGHATWLLVGQPPSPGMLHHTRACAGYGAHRPREARLNRTDRTFGNVREGGETLPLKRRVRKDEETWGVARQNGAPCIRLFGLQGSLDRRG